jgi:hypothetical protein
MTAYVLAAAVLPPRGVTPPPGIDPMAYDAALLADTYDVLDDLATVTVYLATDLLPGPGPGPGPGPAPVERGPPAVATLLDTLHAAGATIGAVVVGDVPDLPGLLVGKLFSACEDRPAGVLPASDGRLVGLAARLPAPAWLAEWATGAGLDSSGALEALHAAAPRGSVVVGPGWHRLREPGDVRRLDPRLEGWPRTRALLAGRALPG